ncbi:MAG: hypothetical protein ACKN9V_04135, partial [Pseudomonadota bacterium]
IPMRRLFPSILFLIFSIQIFAVPTQFENLDSHFRRALSPSQKGALGYWAGHCVHSHDPETRWPAVYVHKAILDSTSNVERMSQTYFWEKRTDPSYFLRFSTQQIEQYSPYRSWAQKEQWTTTEKVQDSLTNTFELPNGGTIVRSVRVDETEFTRTYLMQVNRRTPKGTETISYCSFSQELETTVPVENSPTFWVHTGPVGNTFAEIRLPFQKRAMKSLVIRKKMGEVATLSQIEVFREDGTKMMFSPTSFEKGDAIALNSESGLPFRAVAVRFYILGFVSDLEIYGSLN